MITRIISGGQTGADRAALDVALDLGFPVGGWVPQGRLAEDGPLSERYPLQECPSPKYAVRAAWNVRDSDATLILCSGQLTPGSRLTQRCCEQMSKPCQVVDLKEFGNPAGSDQEMLARKQSLAALAKKIYQEWWQGTVFDGVLNVAGTRESKCPGIYTNAYSFFCELLMCERREQHKQKLKRN